MTAATRCPKCRFAYAKHWNPSSSMWGDPLADHAADYHQDEIREVLELAGWTVEAIEELRGRMSRMGCDW